MKRFSLFVCIAAALLTSCVKESSAPGSLDNTSPVAESISFSINTTKLPGEDTKALINPGELNVNGNKLKVYDYITYGSRTVPYFDEEITYNGDKWVGEDYEWTRSGTHSFVGWFAKDASGSAADMFGTAPELTSSYTLPSLHAEITDTKQFDFMYSDVVTRTMEGKASDDHSPVRLNLKHLFSAFSIGAVNNADHDVIITKVAVRGLTNNKTASLSFPISGGSATVSVTPDPYNPRTYNFESARQVTIGKKGGSVANILGGESGKYNQANYLMWEQTASELNNVTVYIEYTLNGTAKNYSFKMSDATTPGTTWSRGSKNHIDVIFKESTVVIVMTDVHATKGANELTFNWNRVTGASAIELYDDANGQLLASLSGNATTYTWKGLGDGDTRTIKARAIATGGEASDFKYCTETTLSVGSLVTDEQRPKYQYDYYIVPNAITILKQYLNDKSAVLRITYSMIQGYDNRYDNPGFLEIHSQWSRAAYHFDTAEPGGTLSVKIHEQSLVAEYTIIEMLIAQGGSLVIHSSQGTVYTKIEILH